MSWNSPSSHLGHTAGAGETLRAATHPHYMGILLAVAIFNIQLIPGVSTLFSAIMGRAGAAEWQLPVLDGPTAVAAALALVTLLLSGMHVGAEVSPDGRELILRRLLFWIPLWSKVLPRSRVRRFTLEHPNRSFGEEGPSVEGSATDFIWYGASMVTYTVVWLLTKVFWDAVTPYSLYLVTSDRDTRVIASGLGRERLAETGAAFARKTGARFG